MLPPPRISAHLRCPEGIIQYFIACSYAWIALYYGDVAMQGGGEGGRNAEIYLCS